MPKSPSLVNLCFNALQSHILYGDDDGVLQGIYELPTELFDGLLKQLPALALHKLQLHMPSESQNDVSFDYDCSGNGRKRVRNDKFDIAWKALFSLRWPELFKQSQVNAFSQTNPSKAVCDWQQKYWEMHLQKSVALMQLQRELCYRHLMDVLGKFKSQVHLSTPLVMRNQLKALCINTPDCEVIAKNLDAIYVKLQNIFCSKETCHLLANSKLQGLLIRRISSNIHLDGLCMTLNQNKDTITTLEFVNCKISLAFLEAISDALYVEVRKAHGVKHFSVKASKLLEVNPASLPPKFISFLSSRSLESLSLCDNHIGKNFAKLTFMALLDASSALSILELSDNNISGWLSDFQCNSYSQALLSRKSSKSLRSLRVLNLRGNNLRKNDLEDLQSTLIHMPVLETLDLADNPFEDDGIKSLISYFVKTSENFSLVNLTLKNCKLSCNGATELLEVLLALNYPLASLSLADNNLGSQIAPLLGDFMHTSIRSLDIRDIGLGSSGFLELRINMPSAVKLMSINISENRGGIQAAEFLEELISKASDLVDVNAAYNLMPPESLKIICSALKTASGKLQRIDLSGNQKLCLADHASALSEFQHDGEPIVLISTSHSHDTLYDDDP